MSKNPVKPRRVRTGKAARHRRSTPAVVITRAPDGRPLHIDISAERIRVALNRWFHRLQEAHHARSAIIGAAPARERLRRKIAVIGAAEFLQDLEIDAPLVEPYWDELMDLVDVDQNIRPPAYTVSEGTKREPSVARTARAFIAAAVSAKYFLTCSEGGPKNQERAAEEVLADLEDGLKALATQIGADLSLLTVDVALPGQIDERTRKPRVSPEKRIYNCFVEFNRDKGLDGSQQGSEDWPLYFYRHSIRGMKELADAKLPTPLRAKYWGLIDRCVGRLIQLAEIRKADDAQSVDARESDISLMH